MPEGLNGACMLTVEDLGTSLYIEGNNVSGREKCMVQRRWNCTAGVGSFRRVDE